MKKALFAVLASAALLVGCQKETSLNEPNYALCLFKVEVTQEITNNKTGEVRTEVKTIDVGDKATLSFAPNVKMTFKIKPVGDNFNGVHFIANSYIQFCVTTKISETEYVLTPAENYAERLSKIDPDRAINGQVWNGGLPNHNMVYSASFTWNPSAEDIE